MTVSGDPVRPTGADALRVASGGPVTEEELAALVVALMSRGPAADGRIRQAPVRPPGQAARGLAVTFEPPGAFGRRAPRFGGWDGRPGAVPPTSALPAHR